MITNKLLLSCLLGISGLGGVVAGSFYLFNNTTSKKNKDLTPESKTSKSSKTNENESASRAEASSTAQADSTLPKV